jgi:hypothetical protein
VLQQWRAGQLQVVVASVAFGMGVDMGKLSSPMDACKAVNACKQVHHTYNGGV